MTAVTVDQADLVRWLEDRAGDHAAVVTVLPDADEVGMDLYDWRRWYQDAVELCFDVSAGPTIFLATDRLHGGEWHDKGALIDQVAQGGYARLWHKVVLRRDPGATDLHRPTYSHLVAYGPGRPGRRTPDVLRAGRYPWRNGIDVDTAAFVAAYLADVGVERVLNPACGVGTLLHACAPFGIVARGCDIDPDRVAEARRPR